MTKPHSLAKLRLVDTRTEADKMAALGPFAKRYGNVPKGTVLPSTHVVACKRVKVADLPDKFLPRRYLEDLEHNQKIPSCCRHPENHEIEALKSHPDEALPDIYILHCTCGRKHRRFCCGATEDEGRPFWAA
jgi:hypothetical protein